MYATVHVVIIVLSVIIWRRCLDAYLAIFPAVCGVCGAVFAGVFGWLFGVAEGMLIEIVTVVA